MVFPSGSRTDNILESGGRLRGFRLARNMDEGENYYRGGQLRFDLSEKPSYKNLKKLVSKDWNTDLTAITDEAGQARFSAFYGDYTIKAAANGCEKTTDEKLGSDSLRSVAIIL